MGKYLCDNKDVRDEVTMCDGSFATVELCECDDKKFYGKVPRFKTRWRVSKKIALLMYKRGNMSYDELCELYPEVDTTGVSGRVTGNTVVVPVPVFVQTTLGVF